MTKYGITLRTEQKITSGLSTMTTQHNVILCKDLDYSRAVALFNQVAYAHRLLFARIADVDAPMHTAGYRALTWLTPPGQPGDDLTIFIDEYEEE